jgi:hypothetical protein
VDAAAAGQRLADAQVGAVQGVGQIFPVLEVTLISPLRDMVMEIIAAAGIGGGDESGERQHRAANGKKLLHLSSLRGLLDSGLLSTAPAGRRGGAVRLAVVCLPAGVHGRSPGCAEGHAALDIRPPSILRLFEKSGIDPHPEIYELKSV